MQHLKVRKIGNSLGVILPKELVDRLGVLEGEEVVAHASSDGTLSLRRADDEFARDMKATEKIMDRYRNALAELAK